MNPPSAKICDINHMQILRQPKDIYKKLRMGADTRIGGQAKLLLLLHNFPVTLL